MSTELGKIQKPSIEDFKESRRLYCLPLLYKGRNAPDDFLEKFDQYWQQAEEHLVKLEKVGKIDKIYHESIFLSDEEGLEAIKQINDNSYKIIKKIYEKGAKLEGLENRDRFYEMMDWARCLSVIIASEKVFNKVSKFYQEAQKERDKFVAKQIDKTLKKNETGLLLMNETDRRRIQFPSDIQIFQIHPPALEEIYQWQRQQNRNRQQEEE